MYSACPRQCICAPRNFGTSQFLLGGCSLCQSASRLRQVAQRFDFKCAQGKWISSPNVSMAQPRHRQIGKPSTQTFLPEATNSLWRRRMLMASPMRPPRPSSYASLRAYIKQAGSCHHAERRWHCRFCRCRDDCYSARIIHV